MKGVAVYFDHELYELDQRREWCRQNFRSVAFTPEQIVAASADWPEWDDPLDAAGLYFLQRAGKICYIGMASGLMNRLYQHQIQRRPFDAVTVIAGLPREWLRDFEAAYIQAWSPPWNAAYPCGSARWYRELLGILEAMPRDLVCDRPEHLPASGTELEALIAKMNSALDF